MIAHIKKINLFFWGYLISALLCMAAAIKILAEGLWTNYHLMQIELEPIYGWVQLFLILLFISLFSLAGAKQEWHKRRAQK